MRLEPFESISEEKRKSKLSLIIKDGIATEIMAVLSGGPFLVSYALMLGASNFQIGLLASIGTLASVLQLFAIYLIQRYQNRRAIVVYTSIAARLLLFGICAMPFLFAANVSLEIIIGFLFLHHTMGAISGLCWTSWMKDFVPENMLGTFFGKRTRYTQLLSICTNLGAAFALDYIKQHYEQYSLTAYATMFAVAGVVGLYGVSLLARTPEPKIQMTNQNIFQLFWVPFKNMNFKNLMIFNSLWLFAINLAAPFFTVYLLKTLNYPLSYVITLTIISQITNIIFLKAWGKYTDLYSNKSVLQICAPIYLCCILAWTFTTLPEKHDFTLPLLVIIHLFTGISVSGINLALSNIGLKLAPKGDGVFYISAKSIVSAFAGGIAPVIGGLFADFFSKYRLSWEMVLKGPHGDHLFPTLELEQWDFFFASAFLIGLVSLYRLSFVKEQGEVEEKVILQEIKREIKNLSEVTGLSAVIHIPLAFFTAVRKKIRPNPETLRVDNDQMAVKNTSV